MNIDSKYQCAANIYCPCEDTRHGDVSTTHGTTV